MDGTTWKSVSELNEGLVLCHNLELSVSNAWYFL